MPSKQDFLFELGCEELPAHSQRTLSLALHEQFSQTLSHAKLSFNGIKIFSTPRRLAVLVSGLQTTQPPQIIERQGPGLQDAYDKNGTPTLVCIGFAKSCGVLVDQLIVRDTPKGQRLVAISEKPGNHTKEILPDLVIKIILKLPISKPMRWGKYATLFVRPVHWVVMLFGDEVIPAEILGVKTSRETFGHRFHHPKPIRIPKPMDYHVLLYSQGFVIADFETRKNMIRKSIQAAVNANQNVMINEELLTEVTGLVEWPVVLKGSFDREFLSIPKECLITAMQTHQKCFPVVDEHHHLQPYFVFVSNITSKNPIVVIQGNERVIRARLSDAVFFYHQDCNKPLNARLEKLNQVVFQDQLGSLGDQTKRLEKLSIFIATKIHSETDTVKHAAQLSKCDLVTDMVSEFPNLQGIMGYYYAIHDHESESCAIAIRDHYRPKFSGDKLPTTLPGCCLALADRIDTLIGVLGVEKFPTGDKDPFALRRAALGIVRIMIEKALEIDLFDTLTESKKYYTGQLTNQNVVNNTVEFIMTRLKSWYSEKNIAVEIFDSVAACKPKSLIDFDRRLKAVMKFQLLPEASSLAAANKRVNNILKKQDIMHFTGINSALFEFDAEHQLAKQLIERSKIVNILYEKSDYEKTLTELSILKEPIDQFFDSVMIIVEDEQKKQNRLALLSAIRQLFTKVADISLL